MQEEPEEGTSEVEATPDAAERKPPVAPEPGEAPKVSQVDAEPEPVSPEKTD